MVTLYFYELVNHISLIRKYIGSIVHQSNLAFHTRVREEEGERRCWQAASKTDPLRERGAAALEQFLLDVLRGDTSLAFLTRTKKTGRGNKRIPIILGTSGTAQYVSFLPPPFWLAESDHLISPSTQVH